MWLLLRADSVQYRTDEQHLWQFFEYADHDHGDHKTSPHGAQQFVYRMADWRIHCNQIERAEGEQHGDDCDVDLEKAVFAITLQPAGLTGSWRAAIACGVLARAVLGCGVTGVLGDGVGVGIQSRYSGDCAYVQFSSRRRALFQTRRHAGSRSWRGRARTRA